MSLRECDQPQTDATIQPWQWCRDALFPLDSCALLNMLRNTSTIVEGLPVLSATSPGWVPDTPSPSATSVRNPSSPCSGTQHSPLNRLSARQGLQISFCSKAGGDSTVTFSYGGQNVAELGVRVKRHV